MQQRKLSFQRISADDAQQQRALVALQWEKDHPAAAAVPAEPKRGPGRPPKKRELALEQAAAEQKPSQKPRTGEYTTWFSSPYLLDVLKMLRAHQFSAKRTVAALKRTAPDDRYARLSDSTIRGWFEKGTKQLLPQFQQQLDGVAVMRSGRPSQMSTAVEEECKRVLLKLRDTGVPVNSHVIHWTLQSIFRDHDPSLLESLQLSQQWLSRWVRSKLQWRWRARTTAAPKLPMDWEEQGVLMAKRIAAQMEMHEVSSFAVATALSIHCCTAVCAVASRSAWLALISWTGASVSRCEHGSNRSQPCASCFVDLRESGQRCCRDSWRRRQASDHGVSRIFTPWRFTPAAADLSRKD